MDSGLRTCNQQIQRRDDRASLISNVTNRAPKLRVRDAAANGWSFFYVEPKTKTSLRKIRSEYLESLDIDLEGDEDDDQDDDDDE